jgi:two-component system nitrogen regulation response regulator NtrX
VICATNKDLGARVREGAFRQDLYFRLNVLHLHIPALRERQEDIPVLADYFLSQVVNREGGREKYFDDEALLYLQNRDFPGNVRELRNLVHRAYLSTTGDVISRPDIERQSLEQKISSSDQESLESLFDKTMPLKELKELFEMRYLTAQLKKHRYNVSQTARSLDVQPSALFRKLKSLNIKVDRFVG